MNDVVICEPVRTPVGRFGGALASLSAVDLATVTLTELVRRTGLGEGDVDDVVLGQCYPNGESPAIGRIAALDAGLGTGVPGLQIDRRCGSGLQAVLYAAGQVATGAARVVVAGGAESMSQVEHYALGLRTGVRAGGVELMDRLDRARMTAGGKDHPVPGGMLETAENLRRELRHRPRGAGRARGPRPSSAPAPPTRPAGSPTSWSRSPSPGRRGKPDVVVDRDEHPRPDTTLDDLAAAATGPAGRRTRSPPSPPATPAARTTAPRCAWSPPATRPSGAGCARCSRCGRGRSPASAPR